MGRQAVVQPEEPEKQRERDAALRPKWLRDVIGQKAVVQRLGITLNACRKLKEPLGHILFDASGQHDNNCVNARGGRYEREHGGGE